MKAVILTCTIALLLAPLSRCQPAQTATPSPTAPNLEDAVLRVRKVELAEFNDTGSKAAFEITNSSNVVIESGSLLVQYVGAADTILSQHYILFDFLQPGKTFRGEVLSNTSNISVRSFVYHINSIKIQGVRGNYAKEFKVQSQ